MPDLTLTYDTFRLELTHRDSVSLLAVLQNNPALVTPEDFQHGQNIYKWFYERLTHLATNYEMQSKKPLPKSGR